MARLNQEPSTVAPVARRFYNHFQQEHAAFSQCIDGISSPSDRERYASLVLNRLMFVYFLQKQGIFDRNVCYLQDTLQIVKNHMGEGKFYEFYQHFLARLFSAEKRDNFPELDILSEGGPCLNARLFETHELERYYTHIHIPDEAFARIFAFFETYRWRIDEQEENELNPAILSHVFEKYSNQKQMGAYYTQEDVTLYIGKCVILPCIFEKAQQLCPAAFRKSGPVWLPLRLSPDRYIPESYRVPSLLPTETEREALLRQDRYAAIKHALSTGALSSSCTELVSYNLDCQRFIYDTIATSEEPALVLAFYQSISTISILDPTCGSGAFLFAALKLLEPLYAVCLARMEAMLLSGLCAAGDFHEAFRAILRQAVAYPNRSFFILKSIIMQNIYGVDIMQEAVEICKLRLFLRLMAQLKEMPKSAALPALAFNIRLGNALVGFTHNDQVSIQSSAGIAQKLEQSPLHTTLCRELDRSLARAYGIEEPHYPQVEQYERQLAQWRRAFLPFHWCVEFHDIMARGGFDVIIGNPPYIENSKLKHYQLQGYEMAQCGNLYAAVIERSLALCRAGEGYLGLIVPLSICGGERFGPLRQLIVERVSHLWLANFEIFPCRLFSGAFQRLSILIARQCRQAQPPHISVTKIQRWYAAERARLIDLISFTPVRANIKPGVFPKLASPLQEDVLRKVVARAGSSCIAQKLYPGKTPYFIYYQEATNYWTKAACRVPFYRKNGRVMPPPHGRFLYFSDMLTARTTMALLNSSLFYVWFATYSDGFHLAQALVEAFPVCDELYLLPRLPVLAERLEDDIQAHARMSTRNTHSSVGQQKTAGLAIALEEFHMATSKSLLDEIDQELARFYHFSAEELDFIINYDIKYRMGRNNEDGRVRE